jgi:hypothetical protein
MTRPRALQINDLTHRFVPLASALAPGLSQNKTADTFSGGNFTTFTGGTITGVFGGTPIAVPAILQSNSAGPYSVAALS